MNRNILLSILLVFIGCTGQSAHKSNSGISEKREVNIVHEETQGIKSIRKDTLINLSEEKAILFLEYNEELELWYDPYIVDCKKNDTIKIKNHTYENGSELNIAISSNKKFIVIDNIIKGYLEMEGEKAELYENYMCEIIDIINACVVFTMQEHCGGEWDENVWVSGDEIIFDMSICD